MPANRFTDLSATATKHAVSKLAAAHPTVVYSAVTGFLGLGSIWLLNTGPIGWLFGAGGVLLSVLAYAVNYFARRDKITGDYLKKLLDEYEQRRQAHLQKLQTALRASGSLEAESQFDRLTQNFETFNRMLGDKLNPEEITYARYLAMAEQVYLGALDNLQDVVNVLQSIQSIDRDYIQKRLHTLKKQTSAPAADETEALLSRLEVYDRQALKVQRYLAQNEEAITRLNEAVAAITDLKTEDTRSKVDLETAMAHLQDIAKRTTAYNRNPKGEAA